MGLIHRASGLIVLGAPLGRQNQRFTRVLALEHAIWYVKINVLRVFYHQNIQFETRNQRFTRVLPSEHTI